MTIVPSASVKLNVSETLERSETTGEESISLIMYLVGFTTRKKIPCVAWLLEIV